MTKKLALMLGVVLSVSCFQAKSDDFVEYGRNHSHQESEQQDERRNQKPSEEADDTEGSVSQNPSDDSKIVKAVEKRRRVDFVEGGGMVVVQVLEDDRSGLQHQKWVVRLSNGVKMQAVYNLDMCERVPLKVGDIVSMGGQFVWTNQGAMLHWLHYDPRQNRPDGFVELNGKVYCGDGERH